MGNICCSAKEDSSWLTEQLETDQLHNRQPMPFMARLDISQIDQSDEEEDLTHRIESKRNEENERQASESSSEWSCDLSKLDEQEAVAEEEVDVISDAKVEEVQVSESTNKLELQVIRCETDHTEEDVQAAMTALEPQ